MIGSKKQQVSSQSGNADDYRQVFLCRVHELLQRGYLRMNAPAFATEEETVITGELAKEMDAELDALEEEWGRFFRVENEKPVNDGKRQGKERKRIDVHVESSEHKPRRRFSFEAKRLAPKKPVRDYLGREGLGCFLRGEYSANDLDAGMLGCIQSGKPLDWANEIKGKLLHKGSRYSVLSEECWSPHVFPRGPAHSYVSTHKRRKLGRIDVYHTLLVFC